jgi:DNA-binding beta-propeller fold protein YncE
MKKLLTGLISLLFVALGSGGAWADRGFISDRDAAKPFATLPSGVRFPEGITANPANGDIYVGTFDTGAPNKLLRFDRHGRLEAARDFGSEPLLGLEFDRGNKKVYIANVGIFGGGASRIQRIPANFGESTTPEDVAFIPTDVGAPDPRLEPNPDGSTDTISFGSNFVPVPNALVLDSHGNLYVSDSFQGAIFRIDDVAHCQTPCTVTTISHDPLLATAGVPPFGANGLALSADETSLFIANTGDDRVLKLDLNLPPQSMNAVSVFTESINGADGIVSDRNGTLWVCANQNDEIVGVNNNGRVIARLGDFKGIDKNGAPKGLLFPASPVIVGDELFVTNLALALTGDPNDEQEDDVKIWTVSRIKLPHH